MFLTALKMIASTGSVVDHLEDVFHLLTLCWVCGPVPGLHCAVALHMFSLTAWTTLLLSDKDHQGPFFFFLGWLVLPGFGENLVR